MPDKKYIDIKVVDGGWDIDAGQQPQECSDLYSVAQDIKHSIMESGLARELIAERSPVLRSDVLIQIEQLAEQDIRIIPGTATATEAEAGDITLTAETYEYGDGLSIIVGEVEIKTTILDDDEDPDPEPEPEPEPKPLLPFTWMTTATWTRSNAIAN